MGPQKPKQPSRAELIALVRTLQREKTATGWVSVLRTLVKTIGWVAVAYFAKESIVAFAGVKTFAELKGAFLADVRVSEWAAWLLVVLFGGYGLRQKKLRGRTIERLSRRNAELEALVDPNRTSSRLGTTGETRPEDII